MYVLTGLATVFRMKTETFHVMLFTRQELTISMYHIGGQVETLAHTLI